MKIIHAKRNVASSEYENSKRILSTLTTKYFNSKNKSDPEMFSEINKQIVEMDSKLDGKYEEFFQDFLSNSQDFLNLDNLKVVSNLESASIVNNSSRVVYGDKENYLPEHFNGLGFLNILYLLLSIEISNEEFIYEGKHLNLLFIEEPEAHTHPQMQYVFSDRINSLIKKVPNLQTVITTHSPHIVSKCVF